MTISFLRATGFAIVACAFAATAAAADEGAAAASAPEGASAASPVHVHIEDVACWPKYPEELRAAGVAGLSTIRLGVDAAGVVRHVDIETASGKTPAHRILDARAGAALATCRIDPARDARGQPTAGDAVVTWTWAVPAAAAGGDGAPVAGTASVGMAPVPMFNEDCRTDYPNVAVHAGAMGTTKLRIDVDAGGRAVASTLVQSAGPTREHKVLDEAIRRAAMRCPYKPALDEAGAPVAGRYDLSFVWRLE